jgi:hypothetical protein
MSTSGHYTRYINQFPGYYDNCDTMRGGPIDHDIGMFQIEHTYGNKQAFCWFDNYGTISYKYGYDINFEAAEYTGKLAIQYLLKNLENIVPESYIVDRVFKEINFYKFAYLDYISRIETINPNEETRSTLNLNDWLDCDVCHCVQSEKPFRCDYMIETKRACFESGHPVCKYFQALKGSIEVTA